MDQPQAGGEHGFEADRAGRGLGEWQTLGLDVLRIVIRHHYVDSPASIASTSALRSSSARNGGATLRKVRYGPIRFH